MANKSNIPGMLSSQGSRTFGLTIALEDLGIISFPEPNSVASYRDAKADAEEGMNCL